MKTKNKIRYAVVGLGYIAQVAVLPAFQNAEGNSVLTALVSGDPDKLKKMGEKYKVDKLYLYSQFEECLRKGEVDAVYIATPNFYHRNIMETAAKYGVHVLCEKPMAVTTEDCLSMIQSAEKNHIKMMIAYRLHFESANLDAIKIAHSKILGDLKIFNSIFTMEVKDKENIRLKDSNLGGGPLYDIGIYCINAARSLFKAEPIEVFAFSDARTDVSVMMKFSQNRIANFTISFAAFATAEYDLIGTKGRIKLEQAYHYANAIKLKIYHDKKIVTKKFGKRDQFGPELIYFSDCIQKDKQPEPSGEEGLIDVKIIEALLLSLDIGYPIPLGDLAHKTRPTAEQKSTRQPIARTELYNAKGPSGETH
jgi:predicted dehydrogenase